MDRVMEQERMEEEDVVRRAQGNLPKTDEQHHMEASLPKTI